MSDLPIVFRSATELAQQIRQGLLTSAEVVDAHLRQIERWNPRIQAMVSLRAEEALREAAEADQARQRGQPLGPLHGVPITLKDSLRVRGVSSTYGGLPGFARHKPSQDCRLMERLRRAGVIVLGRTNLPLLALNWQCDNPFFAECVNPWDDARTPGGSSGGAAAALAAGFSPLDLGSDLGGSIRYPAHCCGVLGLRTTVGLLPADDIGPEGMAMTLQHLLSLGPMARSIPDLSLMLDVLTESAPARRVSKTLSDPKLRIAVTPSMPGSEPDAATAALLEALCAGLRTDGHQIEIGSAPSVDLDAAWRIWGIIAGFEFWQGVPTVANNPLTRFLFRSYMLKYKLGDGPFTDSFFAGMTASRRAYEEALVQQQSLLQRVDSFFHRYAMWLLPVCMGEAIHRQRRGSPIQVGLRSVPYSQYLGAYTVPTTVFETPVLTLPVGLGSAGLPVGIQVHGPRFADRQLLEAAQRALSRFVSVQIPPRLRQDSAAPPA